MDHEMGTSQQYWAIVWIWLTAPLVHSESREVHRMVTSLCEEVRLTIEKLAGQTDPWRKSREDDLWSLVAFSQRVTHWPQGPMKMQDFMFWFLMAMDVHTPIIERFGRYPYRNGMLARTTTDEELVFLDDTRHFGELKPEVAERIAADVDAGRWTPLEE
jgi:hypothetical protein